MIGDDLDYWRVLVSTGNQKRLLLYAEMKLPGEAWLELRVMNNYGRSFLEQTAPFHPRGV
ncbi:MAG: DUF2867 domain-containing protein [Bacteroidales bacterium]